MVSGQEDAIKNLTSIDMIGKRKDGGVDLVIVVSKRLRGTREHQKLLMDKVEAYLMAINSEAFQKDFGNPPSYKTRILVKCLVNPDPLIVEFVHKMEKWVKENNARIKLQLEKVD